MELHHGWLRGRHRRRGGKSPDAASTGANEYRAPGFYRSREPFSVSGEPAAFPAFYPLCSGKAQRREKAPRTFGGYSNTGIPCARRIPTVSRRSGPLAKGGACIRKDARLPPRTACPPSSGRREARSGMRIGTFRRARIQTSPSVEFSVTCWREQLQHPGGAVAS